MALQCKVILEWQRVQMEASLGGILGLLWMKNGIFHIRLSFLIMTRWFFEHFRFQTGGCSIDSFRYCTKLN